MLDDPSNEKFRNPDMRSGEREVVREQGGKRKSSIGRWHGIGFLGGGWRPIVRANCWIRGISDTIARSVIFQQVS
jgi:hypothetical protein